MEEGRKLDALVRFLQSQGVDVPSQITRDNVNTIYIERANQHTLLEVAVFWDQRDAICELLEMGARFTRVAMCNIMSTSTLRLLLKKGGDPDCVLPIVIQPNSQHGYDKFKLLLDYGAKIPDDLYMRALSPDHLRYVERVRAREARCRATLVALGAYCRRSPYHALRAWYRELAKCMWRMRGPAGCGPRGVVWAEIK